MEQKPNSTPVNLPQILLLVAMAANLLWIPTVLKSSRPAERVNFQVPNVVARAEARLWQDPFAAVAGNFARELTNQATMNFASPFANGVGVTVLGIMVTGSPYQEGAEWRLRARYAALAGLTESGFRPVDREHVWFAAWNPQPVCEALGTNLVVMPYEWFKSNNQQAVLLVWLQDEQFEEKPLPRLTNLWERLTKSPALTNVRNPKFKLIGPWSSTTLQALWKESAATNGANSLRNLEIFSTSATCADRSYDTSAKWRSTDDATAPRRDLTMNLSNHWGITFHNSICTDDQLVRVLIEELQLRGIALTNGDDQVALVAECDTDYGQWLPGAFAGVLADLNPNMQEDQVLRFIYLRGVDGQLADDEAPAKKTEAAGNSSTENQRERADEVARPEGRAQLDYIPRLVHRIKQMQREDGKLKAIGILGSDVYDKLLLLQSLRAYFPGHVFFTTDLDARLSHPRELKWSRNLIVASSFGLQLTNTLQGGTPPFRDGYQTAEFLACRAALGTNSLETNFDRALAPLVFEIGQRGPHQLRRVVKQENSSLNPPAFQPWDGVFRHTGPMVALLASLFGLVVLSGAKARQCLAPPCLAPFFPLGWCRAHIAKALGLKHREKYFIAASIAGWIIAGLMIFAIVKDARDPTGEPFTFNEGISVWPTELLRLLIFYLCGAFMLVAWRDLKTNWSSHLHKDFAALLTASTPENAASGEKETGCFCPAFVIALKKLWERRSQTISISRWLPGDDRSEEEQRTQSETPASESVSPPVDAAKVVKEYHLRAWMRHRVLRFLPAALLYMFFGTLLFVVMGFPMKPARGYWARTTDIVLVYLSVLAFVLLLFFVVDSTRLCAQMTELLTKSKTAWGKAFDNFRNSLGVPDEYLDEWMDIQFIARASKPVVRLIYYPFVVLTLMILSRNNYFDSWDWPVALLLILGCSSVYAVYCALRLRGAAEHARARSLETLREKLFRIQAGKPETGAVFPADYSKLADQIKMMIDEIEKTDEGAFAGLSKHPVVAAVCMPFGGAGILALLEYLATH